MIIKSVTAFHNYVAVAILTVSFRGLRCCWDDNGVSRMWTSSFLDAQSTWWCTPKGISVEGDKYKSRSSNACGNQSRWQRGWHSPRAFLKGHTLLFLKTTTWSTFITSTCPFSNCCHTAPAKLLRKWTRTWACCQSRHVLTCFIQRLLTCHRFLWWMWVLLSFSQKPCHRTYTHFTFHNKSSKTHIVVLIADPYDRRILHCLFSSCSDPLYKTWTCTILLMECSTQFCL